MSGLVTDSASVPRDPVHLYLNVFVEQFEHKL